jgi:CO dehydrogenase/acetyl-CoA synthase beta subunit
MTDGNNVSIEVMVNIGKRDVIEIEGKMYDTIEITPNMEMLDKLKKVVKKSDHPQLKVWVTADEKKIPIKIRTKVGIISFDFDLVLGPP